LRVLQRDVLRAGEQLDVLDLARGIPPELGWTQGHPPRCLLTVRGIAACPHTELLLDHVVRVVQLAAQRYLEGNLPVDELHLRSDDLREELKLTEDEALRVSRLVLNEPMLFSSGWSANQDAPTGPWDRQLNDGIRHFIGIGSIQDYLDVQARHHWRPQRAFLPDPASAAEVLETVDPNTSSVTRSRRGFEARVLRVLIASPGDTAQARDVVEATVQSWNRDRARSSKVVLLPLRWEFDAVPELGADAQSVINRQLVDDADIVVGLFDSRLGQPTSRGASGTAEEIDRSAERGAKVHVFFSETPVPRDVDTDQLTALREFKGQLQERGLVGSYASHEDLIAKVRTCLERDVAQLVTVGSPDEVGPAPAAEPGAILRARYETDREPQVDSRGRVRMRTRRERLVVENLGTAVAEDVELQIDAIGEGQPPLIADDKLGAERIPPQGMVAFLVAMHMGVASQWRVTFRWHEEDSEFTESQTVTAL
jgi:hypothetical protein